MTISELDAVVLERDVPAHGLRRGDVGAVVFVHSPEKFEVEFVLVSGSTQALVELSSKDVRAIAGDDIPAMRHIERPVGGVA